MSTLWSYIRGQLTPTPSGKGDHQIWWSKVKGLLDIVFGISLMGCGSGKDGQGWRLSSPA